MLFPSVQIEYKLVVSELYIISSCKSLVSISVLSKKQTLDKFSWSKFFHNVYHENLWPFPCLVTFYEVVPIYRVGNLVTLVSRGTCLRHVAKWEIYFKNIYLILWAKLSWVLSTNFQWRIWQARNDYWALGLLCASVHSVE